MSFWKIAILCIALIVLGVAMGGWKEFRARLGAVLIGLGAGVLVLAAFVTFYVLPKVEEVETRIANAPAAAATSVKDGASHLLDEARKAVTGK